MADYGQKSHKNDKKKTNKNNNNTRHCTHIKTNHEAFRYRGKH